MNVSDAGGPIHNEYIAGPSGNEYESRMDQGARSMDAMLCVCARRWIRLRMCLRSAAARLTVVDGPRGASGRQARVPCMQGPAPSPHRKQNAQVKMVSFFVA